MAQEHGSRGRSLGDIHHGNIQQLLQAFAAMLTVASLNDGVKGLAIAHHRIHNSDRGKIALEIPLNRFGPKARGQSDYLRAWRSHFLSLHADGMGHRLGGIHVHDQNAHDF